MFSDDRKFTLSGWLQVHEKEEEITCKLILKTESLFQKQIKTSLR